MSTKVQTSPSIEATLTQALEDDPRNGTLLSGLMRHTAPDAPDKQVAKRTDHTEQRLEAKVVYDLEKKQPVSQFVTVTDTYVDPLEQAKKKPQSKPPATDSGLAEEEPR